MEKNEIKLPETKDELTLKKEEEQKILSSTFFKKYKPIKLISQLNYSYVYKGVNIETK